MAVLELDAFFGERPMINPHKLRPQDAQVARNARLWSGAVAPMRGHALEQATTTGSPPATIFKHGDTWLEWTALVNAAESIVANDAHDRVFFTGDGAPRVSDNSRITSGGVPPFPAASLRLGVPAPDSAPGVTLDGTADDPDSLAESRFYYVTFVNSFGEEGPNSPASAEVEWRDGQHVDLTLPSVPGGSYDFDLKRIYRTNGGIIQFVDEVTAATASYADTVSSGALGEELPSAEWDQPPDDLEGLIAVNGTFFAGFRGNELCLSEIGLPHAWPLRYRQPVGYDIVGLGSFSGTIVILTKGVPYIAQGADPGALALTETDLRQACVSREGIVSMGSGVAYPSPDGMMYVDGQGARLITQTVFSRDDWQELNPSSIKGALWERLYVGFYDTGVETGAFILNPAQPDAGVVFLDESAVLGRHNDLIDDSLYLVVGSEIRKWDAGSDRTLTWRSRKADLPRPDTMGVLQVFADSYPTSARVFADGVQQADVSITSDRPVRIGSGRRARTYEVELYGTSEVRRAVLSSTMQELSRL